MFVLVAGGGGDGVAAAEVRFKVLLMVLFEEELDLLGEEVEELFGCFGDHEFLWDGHFRLGEVEGRVAVQLDGADAEVGSAEVDGEVDALGELAASAGTGLSVSMPTFSVPLGTPVTYVGIWLIDVPSFSRPSSVFSLIRDPRECMTWGTYASG